MSEHEPESFWAMTEQGWQIAGDIWRRFAFEGEDINEIAAEYDLTIDHLTVLMSMAFSGGGIKL